MAERPRTIAELARTLGTTEDSLLLLLEEKHLASKAEAEALPSQGASETFAEFLLDESSEKPKHRLPSNPSLRDPNSSQAEPSGAFGRYMDLGVLGIGGMGEVRRVEDPELRRTLAMKIIHQDLMSNSRMVSRFIEEAQIQAQLQHPNIVPVHEISRLPDGRAYFTMKEIEGTEFSKKIKAVHFSSSDERWNPAKDGTTFRDLIRIFHQICETIAYAHSKGLVHRDLKPDNIMLGGFGEVLVVDWGLAKLLGRDEPDRNEQLDSNIETDRSNTNAHQTRVGSVSGTPCYMAPEQAFGRTSEVGLATDVYTLGAILYEILSGLPPFSGKSAEAVIESVKHSRPTLLRTPNSNTSIFDSAPQTNATGQDSQPEHLITSNAKIPARLAEICETAMQREIGERTASAQDLANELKAWMEGAEKRDKGLKEVEKARQLAGEAQGQERKAAAEWREANSLMEREGAKSEKAWALWTSSRKSQSEARMLWRRHVRKLQGALVHAPDLEDAHQVLAELRIEELIAAAAVGNRANRETRTHQLSTHLQALPVDSRVKLEAKRDAGLADVIVGQRFRRGTLVGRQNQREAVVSQVEAGAQLLTLLGTAGVGKTRLALELAQDLRAKFSRTVFCDLTQATDALGIAQRMSRALNIRLRDTNPVGHLVEVLATEPTLLILDNLEQLAAVIGPLASEWVRKNKSLQILATSRLRLGVAQETVVPIQPLSLLEGVDLFVRRGQAADSRFEVGPKQRSQICALVERLDSLPLALELAAARLNILSMDELSARLGERFSLLRSRGRDAKALDGALDWSWGLLQSWDKAALSQASLFRGGFTLAAAEGVFDVGSDKKTPAMFDILGELVDNSLLRRDQAEDGNVRYTLLESIRAYSHDKLGEPGKTGPELHGPEALKEAQQRHAAHFSQLGNAKALQALDSFDSSDRWEALFIELDNLVAAIEHGTAESTPLCCLAALKVLGMKGPVSLGVDIATEVLQISGLGKRVQMLLEIERSKCLRISGRMAEARAMVGTTSLQPQESDSVALSDRGPSTQEEAGASLDTERHPDLLEAERLMALGDVEYEQSRFGEAFRCYQSALDIVQNHDDRAGEGKALGYLGNVHQAQGKHDQAVTHYTQAIDIAREIGDKRFEGIHLGNLGVAYQAQGEHDQAISYYTQAIDIAQEIGDKRFEGIHLGNLGISYQAQDEHDQAITYYTQGLEIVREIGDKRIEGTQLGNLGDIFFKIGRFDESEVAFRQAISICDQAMPVGAGAFRGSLALLLAQQGVHDEAQTLLETGEPLVETYPEEHAKFLASKGQVFKITGDINGARSALKQAQEIAAKLKVTDETEVGKAVAALVTVLAPAAEVTDEERELALIEAARMTALGDIEYEQSRFGEAFRCYQAVLEIVQRHGDRTAEGKALGTLGNIHEAQGQNVQAIAHFTQAIDIAREVGDKRGEAKHLGNLGLAYQAQGQHDQAIAHQTEALDIAREIGDKRSEGIQLGNLGSVHLFLGQHDQAITHYTQAIDIAREIGDKRIEGIQLGNLGSVHLFLGQHDQAITHYTQAIDIAREIGNKRGEGIQLGNLGDAFSKTERFKESEAAFRQALLISDETFPAAAGAFRGSLALLLAQQGKHDEAWDMLEAGEPQVETYPEEHAKFLCKKGQVCKIVGDTTGAQAALKQAQEIAAKLKVTDETEVGKAVAALVTVLAPAAEVTDEEREFALIEAARLIEQGRVEHTQSRFDEAFRCYQAALGNFQRHGDRTGEGKVLGHLGTVYRFQGHYDQAIRHYTQGLEIAREVGDKRNEGVHLGNLGDTFFNLGRFDESEATFCQAISICDQAMPAGAGAFRGSLALLLAQQGRHDEAQALLETGAAQVETHPEEHAKFLSKWGQVYHIAGDIKGAQAALKQAQKIAAELNFTDESEVAQAVVKLAALLSAKTKKDSKAIPASEVTDEERELALIEAARLMELGNIENAQSHFGETLRCYQAALNIIQRHGDRVGEGKVLGKLGLTYQAQGQYDRAVEHYTQALDIAREVGDKRNEGLQLGSLATVYKAQGQLDQAIEHYSQGINIAREIGNKRIEGAQLGNLGNVYLSLGQPDKAIDLYTQALDIAGEVGDKKSEGLHLGNLGNTHQGRGQYDQAITCYTQALDIAKKIGNKRSAGIQLGNLGEAFFKLERRDEAEAAFSEGISICDETLPGASGAFRGSLALLLAQQGKHDKARALFETGEPQVETYPEEHAKFLSKKGQACNIAGDTTGAEAALRQAQEIAAALKLTDESEVGQAVAELVAVLPAGDSVATLVTEFTEEEREIALTEAQRLVELGHVECKEGNNDVALPSFQKARDIYQRHGDRTSEGKTIGALGNAYQALGQYERAIEHCTQAIDIAREVGDKRSEGLHLGNLGKAYQDQGQYDPIYLYTQALDIARTIGDKRIEGIQLGNLGNLYRFQGEKDLSIAHYAQALDIAREIQNKANEGIALGNLGETFFKAERLKESEAALRKAVSICDETFPMAAGVFSGSLALLLARQGKRVESQVLLETGESQVRAYPQEHAKFLCKKGHVCNIAGDTTGARTALKQAQKITAKLKVNNQSELGQTVAELVTVLSEGAAENSAATPPTEVTDEERELALIEAARLIELGHVEYTQGRFGEAFRCYKTALDIVQRHNDRASEGKTIGHLGTAYRLQGQHDQAIVHYTQAHKIAREVGDKRHEGVHLGNLAITYQDLGQYERAIAHYTQALDIARETGDKRSESSHLGHLGLTYQSQGQHDHAIAHYTQALNIGGNKSSEGRHLGNLGLVYQAKGQHDEAIAHYTQALDISREVGDSYSEGIHLGNLGDALVKLHRRDEGETAFINAIKVCDEHVPVANGAFRGSLALLLAQQGRHDEAQALLEIGEPQVKTYPQEHAKFLCKKGQACHIAGDTTGARAALKQAQKITAKLKVNSHSDLGQAVAALIAVLLAGAKAGSDATPPTETTAEDRDLALIEAGRLMELGNIDCAQSRFVEAFRCYKTALDIVQKHGDRAAEGKALGYIGNTYQAQGQADLAIEHYNQAIDVAREVGDKRSEGIHLGNLGLVYQTQGQHDHAIEYYTQSLGIARTIGDKRNEGNQLGQLGVACHAQGENDQAIAHYIQGIDIVREIGDKRIEGIQLGNLGIIYQAQGRYDQAIERYSQALDIGREIGDKLIEGTHLGNLGDAFYKLDRFEESETAFRRAISICDETLPLGAGVFRGSLALLLAQQGRHDETQTLLETGEPQVGAHPEEQAKFLCKKSQICHIAGNTTTAWTTLNQAQNIAVKLKLTHESEVMQAITSAEVAIFNEKRDLALLEADRLMELGKIEIGLWSTPQALDCFENALAIFQAEGDRKGEGRATGNLGGIYLRLVDDKADDFTNRAIAIAREVGDKASEGRHLANLGGFYKLKGDHERAVEHYSVAIDSIRELGNERSEGIHLGNLACVYTAMGLYDQAIEVFTQAIKILRAIGDKGNEANHRGNLGLVFLKKQQFEKAETALLQAIATCDEVFPIGSGCFRAALALLKAQTGHLEEAQNLLTVGLTQVEDSPEELTKYLCYRGQICHIVGDTEGAQAALKQAEGLASKLKVSPESELSQTIMALTNLLSDSEA